MNDPTIQNSDFTHSEFVAVARADSKPIHGDKESKSQELVSKDNAHHDEKKVCLNQTEQLELEQQVGSAEQLSETDFNSENETSRGDTLLKSMVFLGAITLIQKSLGFFRSVFVCRALAPEEMGTWSMIFTLIETALPLFILSIPACFGRYFETFANKGQLHAFVRQSFAMVLSVFAICSIGVILFQSTIAKYVFGSPELTNYVIMALIAVIPFGLFGVGCQMLTALRVSRLSTVGNFIYGFLFTTIAVTLLWVWNASAISMFIAFLTAHLLALAWVGKKLFQTLNSLPKDTTSLKFISTWKMLTPIIFVFWISDFLTNFFFSVDRFMLINLTSDSAMPVLAQIGNYESAHVIPYLFATVTALAARTLLPYLSRDWESKDFDNVHFQVNLSIKIAVLILVTGGLCFLPASNLIFETLFQGKYTAGESIVSYVLFFYVGNAICYLLMNYFWCRQKGGVATVAMLLSLIVNIAANSFLISSMGIAGAAIGTVIAISFQVICLYLLAIKYELKPDYRMITVLALPTMILLGKDYWAGGLIALFVCLAIGLIFTRKEREVLSAAAKNAVAKIIPNRKLG